MSQAITAYSQWLARPHTFIQIGANDGALCDPIANFVQKCRWRGVMVEPLPYYFDLVKARYKARRDLIFVQAFVAEKPGMQQLYYVDPGVIAAKKLPPWLNGIASFNRKNLVDPIDQSAKLPDKQVVKDALRVAEVPAITLKMLAAMLNEPVDVLQIDTQGYDCRILMANDFATFKPPFIHFETETLLTPVPEQQACLQHLTKQGYVLTRDSSNTVAAVPAVATSTSPDQHFTLRGTAIGYYNGTVAYNNPTANERRVELPLAERFLMQYDNVVELGAVTPYYFDLQHPVVDIGDPHARNLLVDALHVRSFKGKNVLSISTIEHIRAVPAIAGLLDRVRAEAAHYLITFPIGAQRAIEEHVKKNWPEANYSVLVRKTVDNRWEEDPGRSFAYDYAKPYRWGNAICVLHSHQP